MTMRQGRGRQARPSAAARPEQSGDIRRADNHFHWHEAALARGYRGAVCLPLRDGSRSFGVLCLYSGEAQHFTAGEIRLLQELADNLAFGIVSLRARLERRRSQEAARQAAAKLREQASLLDRAQDAIMVRNLDRTIRFWNKGAERLYGWTAEEVLGKTMEDLMYHSPEVLAAAMAQTVANDGDWTGELEERARDGSTVCVEARWTVVRDEQGQVNGVLGINSDIRERKRAREEIMRLNASLEERVQQRTAQLEFANKQLEAFSYSVSHDLRSPLSAVDGFSDLLERAMAKAEAAPLTGRSRHYLTRIRAGVSQMGELIDAMLTLAQVSRSSLRWEPVDLSALATAVLDGWREREPERKVRIEVEPGLTGQGDPRLLKQVLDNLLGNAWKFSAKQPLTDITFGHEVNAAGETVYFVRDKGTGFDMAYAEKLFGAFQRLHSLSEFAGTGIGLATVQRIVARHGGSGVGAVLARGRRDLLLHARYPNTLSGVRAGGA
jgi:PAS domain S-box-containing protein